MPETKLLIVVEVFLQRYLVLEEAPKVIASMIEESVFSSFAPNVGNLQPE